MHNLLVSHSFYIRKHNVGWHWQQTKQNKTHAERIDIAWSKNWVLNDEMIYTSKVWKWTLSKYHFQNAFLNVIWKFYRKRCKFFAKFKMNNVILWAAKTDFGKPTFWKQLENLRHPNANYYMYWICIYTALHYTSKATCNE